MYARSGFEPAFLVAALLIAGAGTAVAQCGHMQSHASDAPAPPTARDVADAVQDYVRHESKVNGDHFVVFDTKADASLVLTFRRVREDVLRTVGDDEYFTCAEFEAADGTKYDLDVFVEGPDKDRLSVTHVRVHKEGGAARYDWDTQDGHWTAREYETATPEARSQDAAESGARHAIRITVDGSGFHIPSGVALHVGIPATLVVTRTTDRTCAKDIVFRSLDISKPLPLDEPVEIVIIPQQKGDLRFACAMDMWSGVVRVE